MKRKKPNKQTMPEEIVQAGGSYDAVETAIDLAKKAKGSWKGPVAGTRIRPWVSEMRPAATDTCPSRGRRA